MRITGLLSWAIAAGLLWPVGVSAQRAVYAAAAAAEARPLAQAQRLERRFLQLTAENLRFQGEAARIVLARSPGAGAEETARALLERRQAVEPELLRLLHARGMAMPLPENDHNKVLKQLGKLQGARRDRVFLEEVAQRSLQADLANHEKVAGLAEDPVLKAWIERQLPLLRELVARGGKVPAPAAPPGAAVRAQRAL